MANALEYGFLTAMLFLPAWVVWRTRWLGVPAGALTFASVIVVCLAIRSEYSAPSAEDCLTCLSIGLIYSSALGVLKIAWRWTLDRLGGCVVPSWR
jgi:hypothetical protein